MGRKKTVDGVEKVYAAANTWVERALKADDSRFTPGIPIWSSRWLGELRKRFLDRPDTGEGNFTEKLEGQLADSPPEVYQLMGEVLYSHFLIAATSSIRRETKEAHINRVLGWSQTPVEIPQGIGDVLTPGIGGPGQGFN